MKAFWRQLTSRTTYQHIRECFSTVRFGIKQASKKTNWDLLTRHRVVLRQTEKSSSDGSQSSLPICTVALQLQFGPRALHLEPLYSMDCSNLRIAYEQTRSSQSGTMVAFLEGNIFFDLVRGQSFAGNQVHGIPQGHDIRILPITRTSPSNVQLPTRALRLIAEISVVQSYGDQELRIDDWRSVLLTQLSLQSLVLWLGRLLHQFLHPQRCHMA